MKVKICGVRDVKSALVCEVSSADFIGLNFVPDVHRKVDILSAIEISNSITTINKVGVFADQPLEDVISIINQCGLDYVQLSGNENIEYCSQIGLPVIKSLKIEQNLDITTIKKMIFPEIDNFINNKIIPLVESSVPGSYGGTGTQISVDIAKEIAENFDVILAGGLTPLNVKSMIDYIKPWGVDVASGVESGKKQSTNKIIEFISNAKNGDNE
tara:strand:+ start:4906 stop:5547 length:642 start_codon:yes stop_codon:yes gene_type:complete